MLLALAPLPAWAAKAPPAPAATVITVTGDVTVDRGGAVLPLALADPVYERDTVRTGPDGKVRLLFTDASAVALAPGSVFEMEVYADAGKDSNFAAGVFQGAVRIITGGITEKNSKGFKITTPLATVGIRGTILTIEADDKHTTVRVTNSERSVIVNDVPVKESFKITVTKDADPKVERMAPGEAAENAEIFSQKPPAPAPSEGDSGSGGSGLAVDDLSAADDALGGLTAGGGGLDGAFGGGGFMADSSLGGGAGAAMPAMPTWVHVDSPRRDYSPSVHYPSVPHSVGLGPYFDVYQSAFNFDIDLLTGDIANAHAYLVGYTPLRDVYLNDSPTGTGNFFTGVTWDGIPPRLLGSISVGDSSYWFLDPATTKMIFTGSYANVGDQVFAIIHLQNRGGEWIEVAIPEPGVRQ